MKYSGLFSSPVARDLFVKLLERAEEEVESPLDYDHNRSIYMCAYCYNESPIFERVTHEDWCFVNAVKSTRKQLDREENGGE